jgi:hypothetical protein
MKPGGRKEGRLRVRRREGIYVAVSETRVEEAEWMDREERLLGVGR